MGKNKEISRPVISKTMDASYRLKLSAFIHQFIIFEKLDPKYFRSPDMLTDYGFKDLTAFLINQNIFDSKDDFKRRAMFTYHIIVPEWIFEGVENNGSV